MDCIHRNGDITNYSVQYGVQGSGIIQIMSVSRGATTEATISGLIPSTSYVIHIAAVNSAGVGVYSEPLTVETSVEGESIVESCIALLTGPKCIPSALLWLLAPNMHSSGAFVRFLGVDLSNHSYVDLTAVGAARDGSDSVQCHTDLSTCCNAAAGGDHGDWYFPNGTQLPYPIGIYIQHL